MRRIYCAGIAPDIDERRGRFQRKNMKKIDLLGITLHDFSLWEALRQTDIYLKNGAMNTIVCVTTKMLMMAGEEEVQRQWLEDADMTVFCEVDILRAAGTTGRSRIREIENNSFIREFIKKMARERRRLYLVADTEENMQVMEEHLRKIRNNLRIEGRCVCSDCEEELACDTLVNEINDVAPDVILSELSYPAQEKFLYENRSRINGSIWLGLCRENRKYDENPGKWERLGWKIRRRLFQRKVNKYNDKVSGD